ncbi:MAG: YdeI/OmpD-associated family protein [Patescibacteria group bacterium]
MIKKTISQGVVHKVPDDLKKVLTSSASVLAVWEDITPLARNEWICWVVSPKKIETRKEHVRRVKEHLLEGKRRPCCWAGCPHR